MYNSAADLLASAIRALRPPCFSAGSATPFIHRAADAHRGAHAAGCVIEGRVASPFLRLRTGRARRPSAGLSGPLLGGALPPQLHPCPPGPFLSFQGAMRRVSPPLFPQPRSVASSLNWGGGCGERPRRAWRCRFVPSTRRRSGRPHSPPLRPPGRIPDGRLLPSWRYRDTIRGVSRWCRMAGSGAPIHVLVGGMVTVLLRGGIASRFL